MTPENPQHPLPDLFSAAEWHKLARRLNLSPRQLQVARLICLGLSNAAIAKASGLAKPTVEMHIRILFKKLAVTSRLGVPVKLVLTSRASRRKKASTG